MRQAALVRRSWHDESGERVEDRYFITSLPRNRLSARRLLKAIAGHWSIENSLHNVLDKSWIEDKIRITASSQGCALSLLRRASLNALRVLDSPQLPRLRSLTAKATHMIMNPLKALNLLGQI